MLSFKRQKLYKELIVFSQNFNYTTYQQSNEIRKDNSWCTDIEVVTINSGENSPGKITYEKNHA